MHSAQFSDADRYVLEQLRAGDTNLEERIAALSSVVAQLERRLDFLTGFVDMHCPICKLEHGMHTGSCPRSMMHGGGGSWPLTSIGEELH